MYDCQVAHQLLDALTLSMLDQELSNSLCKFDKRTIELLLTRAERNQPPSHLSDLGTAELMETFGRERRHRYYTVAAFRTLVAREALDDSATGYTDIDYSAIGGFSSIHPDAFFQDERILMIYSDSFKDKLNAGSRKYKLKNPIMPDGSVKIGRPRKTPANGSKAGHKRKRDEGDEDDVGGQETHVKTIVKPRRGRPPKKPRVDADTGAKGADQTEVGEEGRAEVVSLKKRGRPPQKKPSNGAHDAYNSESAHPVYPGEATDGPNPSKMCGRSPKQQPVIVDQQKADDMQQTIGEDVDGMSTSEDAPPKKRGRPPKLRQTSPPRTVESDEPHAQPSISVAETITPTVDLNLPMTVNPLGNNSIAHLQPEEARRSVRNRKPVVRDDNSIPAKQTLPKISVVSKVIKNASQTNEETAIRDNHKPSLLPAEVFQVRVSNQNENFAIGEPPQQPPGSQPVMPSIHPLGLTITPESVDSDLRTGTNCHEIVLEANVCVNITPPFPVSYSKCIRPSEWYFVAAGRACTPNGPIPAGVCAFKSQRLSIATGERACSCYRDVWWNDQYPRKGTFRGTYEPC
jgi:hypothetical protein